LSEHFDDLGFSGSTVDRPAFQRLLRVIEDGKVDIVAVYKIDRLSRSLLDFTQLMRTFEQKGVEFVSTTQQFSTSTSVGRMTLNLLATFAQFERETISERTRDKIAATRRRGMWTGGRPVLGYDAVDGKLVVNEPEAKQVRAVFKAYLACGSPLEVARDLRKRGWTTKSWTNQAGHVVTGRMFDKSAILSVLRNVLYRGKVRLGQEVFAGQHEAIVDEVTWDAADALLKRRARGGSGIHNKWPVLLRKLLTCGVCGSAMTHTFASRGARRYSSYACEKYLKQGAAACPGSRVPLGQLESFVVDRIKAIGRDPTLTAATIESAREQLDAKKPELRADLARVDADRRNLIAERENLVSAIGIGGNGKKAIVDRLAEVEKQLTALDQREKTTQAEIAAPNETSIDPAALTAELAEFDAIWSELNVAERARVLHLLLEGVVFNGVTGEISITFRANGIKGLAEESNGDNA